MSDKFKVLQGTLAADVANAGTFTVGYPSGTDASTFQNGHAHQFVLGQNDVLSAPDSFTVAFGASVATITNASGATWPAGTDYYLQLDITGGTFDVGDLVESDIAGVIPAALMVLDLGAPDVADADGAVASQAITLLSGLATGINGALASGGVATFDVPRNVVAAWTGTAVMTVTGTDVYGAVLKESSASGTSLTGKKAFKTVTAVTVSADVTGATVGTGDVIGLPVFLPGTAYVLKEIQDGAAATAGTLVAGSNADATATTGDVRGTYDPNAACDGAKAFRLVASLPDPKYKGTAQYAG